MVLLKKFLNIEKNPLFLGLILTSILEFLKFLVINFPNTFELVIKVILVNFNILNVSIMQR